MSRFLAVTTMVAAILAALSFPFTLLYPVMDMLDAGHSIGWGTKVAVLVTIPMYVSIAAVSLAIFVAGGAARRRRIGLFVLGAVLALGDVLALVVDVSEDKLNGNSTALFRTVALVVVCLAVVTSLARRRSID